MKRSLSMILAIALCMTMFAGISVGAANATLIESFFDVDFANWANHETLTNKDGSSSGLAWAGEPTSKALALDVEKGKNVLKVQTSADGSYTQLREDLTGYDYFTRNESQWYEWSVKYEDGFAATGFDHNNGIAPVYINNTGMMYRFAERAKQSGEWEGKSLGYQLELGKWYHIVVCMDSVNAPANDGGRLYIWVNGQKIFNGADYSSAFKPQSDGGVASFRYYRFFIDNPDAGTVTTYIDNLKGYITDAGLNDTHAQTDYEVNLTDADANDGIDLTDKNIVAEGRTFAEVKAGITGARLVAVKDGVLLQDSDLVDDAKIYAWSFNGIASKVYTVLGADDQVHSKTYFDVDFENWESGLGNVKNSDGSTINHDVVGDASVVSSATVSDREGKVMKVDVKTSGGSNYLFRSRMNRGIIPANHSDVKVLWNEFSIKYEGGFAGFSTNHDDNAYDIVNINKNGQIALGSRWGYNEVGGGNFNCGTIVSGVQLELGKWYDIKVAADFTDAGASTGVPAYVWVNGKLVANGTKIPAITPTSPWVFQKLYFDQAANEGTVAYVDDIKVYETFRLGEIELPADMVIKNHFDMSFENWESGLGNVKNSDGSSINHDVAGDASVVSSATVSDREGKVMKVDVKTSGGGNYLVRSRMNRGIIPVTHSDVKVLWNEFSIKYEGGFAGFGTNENDSAYSIVNINKNGQIELGSRWGYNEVGGGNFNRGTIVSGVQLELGKWYDIKVAADFTDPGASSGVPVYVWVNDDFVSYDTKIAAITPSSAWVYQKLYFDQAANEGTVAYVDDVKTYETVGLGDIEIPEDILGAHATGIEASIPPANAAHPVSGMINDGISLQVDADVYKSAYYGEGTPLVVTIPLDAWYNLSAVKIYERNLGGQRYAKVEIGKKGKFTTVVDNVALSGAVNFIGTTQISFAKTEGDTIRFTFTGTPAEGQNTYQILELEAHGFKSSDFIEYSEDIIGFPGEEGSALTSIQTSIQARGANFPVEALINGTTAYDEGEPYKSSLDFENAPLKVLVTFDGIYEFDSVKIYERYIGIKTKVDVAFGLGGEFTTLADDLMLSTSTFANQSAVTEVKAKYAQADSILFTFENTDGYEGAESLYQLLEIEAFGGKVADVEKAEIIDTYAFGDNTNNAFIVAVSTPVAIAGEMVVAAYEGDELVALTPAASVNFAKGVTAMHTQNAAGLIKDGRTYKVFVWDSIENATQTPIFKSEIITQ